MNSQRAPWSRRDVLGALTLAGTAGLLGLRREQAAGEPPPETTTLKLADLWIGGSRAICTAPLYVAEGLLEAEGFSDLQYMQTAGPAAQEKVLASGEVHMGLATVGRQILRLEAGDPIVVLAGAHLGCYELFATRRVRALRDLRGSTIAVTALGSGHHVLLSVMLAYVGLDPRKDVNWVAHPFTESMRLLAEEKIDALMTFPPEQQQLRGRGIGHVVVNTALDRPWSHYFCCVAIANREFVRKHPVATKRVVRAILKAADVCAQEPDRAARLLMGKGDTGNYDYALQTMKDVPYSRWREYDPEDTLRFFALRLREVGMIKSNPQKIIAQGTDWRFFNELKRELKA